MSLFLQVLTVIPIVVMFTTLDAKQARFYAQTFQIITKQWMGVLKANHHDEWFEKFQSRTKKSLNHHDDEATRTTQTNNVEIEEMERNFNYIVDRSMIGMKQ